MLETIRWNVAVRCGRGWQGRSWYALWCVLFFIGCTVPITFSRAKKEVQFRLWTMRYSLSEARRYVRRRVRRLRWRALDKLEAFAWWLQDLPEHRVLGRVFRYDNLAYSYVHERSYRIWCYVNGHNPRDYRASTLFYDVGLDRTLELSWKHVRA